MRSRFHKDDHAVGQAVAFIVAAAILIATISVVLLSTSELATDSSGVSQGALDREAQALADILLDSQGVGWENGPDNVTRLGFLGPNGSLDQDHLDYLRGAFYNATPDNGRVDYEEAIASLDLEGLDFHLRIVPAFLVEQLQKLGLGHLRVAYVGDWDSLVTVRVDLDTEEQMKAEAQAKLDLGMGPGTVLERDAVEQLGFSFNNTVFMNLLAPAVTVNLTPLPDAPLLDVLGIPLVEGDVYADDKNYLRDTLPDRLPLYDFLFIGSEVDQSSLTSDDVKSAIADWVLDGGTLLVMGSGSQNFQWLQPLFSVGTTTVSGGAFAPDLGHPLLNVPNKLDWDDYNDFGLAWDLKDKGNDANADDFTHIVVSDDEDVLAVSDEGAFGDGRVFLTSWRPEDIADSQGLEQAMALVENMALYADRSHLYLDYGEDIPDDVLVAAAARHTYLVDPEIGQVPVRFEVLIW